MPGNIYINKHSLKNKPSGRKGKTYKDLYGDRWQEECKKRSKGRKGCKHSLETRKRLSEVQLEWIKNNKEQFKEMFSKGPAASMKVWTSGALHNWMGVGFLSEGEMKCAKKLLTKPIYGVNCHISIGNKTIDFFPQSTDKRYIGCFVEYHPWDYNLTAEEYKEKRKEVIRNSKYKGVPLVIIKSIKEFYTFSNIEKEKR